MPLIGERGPKRREAGPGGPACFSLVVGAARHVKGHCGTPLRSVSSFACRRPLTRLASRPETLNESTFARNPRAKHWKIVVMSGH